MEYYQYDICNFIKSVLEDNEDDPHYSAITCNNRILLYISYKMLYYKNNNIESDEDFFIKNNFTAEDYNFFKQKTEKESEYYCGKIITLEKLLGQQVKNIYGIKFEIPNSRDTFLKYIFENIDVEKYFWSIDEEEVYKNDNSDLFYKNIMSGKEFKEVISEIAYVIFLNLKAFLKKRDICEIKNAEDFKNSNCFISLAINDNILTDICCKKLDDIDKIKKNALKYGFEKITEVKAEKDIFFTVW